MAEFELYCFAQSGNSYKAALMLNIAGADWQPQFVDFFNGEHRAPEYLAMNEMGEVPVLRHGDVVLSQSGVILDYLAEKLGKFGPQDDDERREVLRWMLFDNHKFTSNIATYRFMAFLARVGDPAVHEFLKGRMIQALKVVERRLRDREFLLGDRLTIADFSLLGYLYYPDEFGMEGWPDFPNIRRWTGTVAAMDGFVPPYELMPKAK
ncbi:MAG: glutathione S-transferase [Rhizobiales bacterium NRL2]|nr:MAG: glutathione S-transferase [Rhizobiales bacterium NRL2]